MSKYKRLKGINFVVDYPASYWSGLSAQEQSEIAKFYNDTYTKKAATQTATPDERPGGAANGRYSHGID